MTDSKPTPGATLAAVPPTTDPLRPTYRERLTGGSRVLSRLYAANTALLCIDMQYLDAARGEGVFAQNQLPAGVSPEDHDYYFAILESVMLPNVRRLQDTFRELGLEVIHTRIKSLTKDGRDRSPGHKRLGLHAGPGSREAEFVDIVAPTDDEIILDKTASGVFAATNLQYVLRNLGIDALYVVGVYTNECVSTAARHAADLGFHVTVVDDACATVTPDLHDATIRILRDRYARILSTDNAVYEIKQLAEQDAISTT